LALSLLGEFVSVFLGHWVRLLGCATHEPGQHGLIVLL
jgi:hypothetical protein